MFKIVLKANSREYKSEGISLFEAIDNLGLRPMDVKTKGVIIVYKGEWEQEMFLFPVFLKRLLVNLPFRHLFIRKIEDYFKMKFGEEAKEEIKKELEAEPKKVEVKKRGRPKKNA